MRMPVVDMGVCTLCGGCIELCPEVFRLNDMGMVEVAERKAYPVEAVDEAIKNCPVDCIEWSEP